MTVEEAIKYLKDLKGILDHEATPGGILALSVAIAVLRGLSPEQVKVVNTLYSVNFEPLIEF